MSMVINPSPWYTALSTYKGFQKGYSRVLLSVAHHFIDTHWANIADALGGEPSLATIVPSKRGVAYEDQPLRLALDGSPKLRPLLRQTLSYTPGEAYSRRKYAPEMFSEAGARVRGQRILLIEDLWVTGATCVSAAGALLKLGAEAVAILPIARKFEASYWGDDHPFVRASSRPYTAWNDRGAWPR